MYSKSSAFNLFHDKSVGDYFSSFRCRILCQYEFLMHIIRKNIFNFKISSVIKSWHTLPLLDTGSLFCFREYDLNIEKPWKNMWKHRKKNVTNIDSKISFNVATLEFMLWFSCKILIFFFIIFQLGVFQSHW